MNKPHPALFLPLFLLLSPALHAQPLSDQQLLDLIHQQPPLTSGQLKTILLDNSPLSDTVLIAAFTREPRLPNGIISEISLANSPLSNKVLFVLKDLDPALPPGILNEVFAENTLTIHGRLLNSAGCDTSLQLAGVEVALADLSGNPVTSAALTGLQGEFSLDPDEVAALNPSALFTFVLNSDIPFSFSAPRSPEDWMRQSPVSLFAENTLSASFTFAFTSPACIDFFSEDFPEVEFSAGFPGGVEPYTYQWDFGDGNEDEGESPSNVYEEPGAFTVSLTVIDSLRCVSVAQQQIAIENCPMGVLFNNDACGGGPAGGVALSIRLLIQEEGVNELLFEDFIATTNAAGEFSFDPDDISDLRDNLNDLFPIVPLVAFEPVEGFDIEDQQFVPIDELMDNFPLALTLTQSAIAWHRHEGEALLEDAIDDDPRASVATAIDVHGHVFVAGAIMDEIGNTGSTSFGIIKYDRSGNALWIREFANPTGSQPGNTPTAIVVTDNCEVYVTGVGAEGGGVTHYLTVKYDAAGNLLWSRTYTGSPSVSSQNGARAIARDACGNIYVTGRSTDGSTGDFGDYGTVKYDPDGNLLWAATYKGPATGAGKLDEALAITAKNGKVFVTGYSRGATSRDIATVAYDESGNELWAARYNGAGNGEDLARAIAADITGNVYVTGYSTESGSDRDMIVIKYDAEGDELWTAHHPGAAGAGDEAFALAVHSDGSVYVTGAAAETGLQFPDAFLITQGEDGGLYDFDMVTNRYDTDGSLLWSRSYDGAGATLDGAFDIALDQNGNAYITGVTHSLSKNKAAFAMAFGINSTSTIFVSGPGFGTIQLDPPPLVAFGTGEATTVSYDKDGGERWVHTYKGAGNSQDGFFSLALDDEGGVYATGFSALVDTVTFDVNVKMSTVKVGQCDGAGAVVTAGICTQSDPACLLGVCVSADIQDDSTFLRTKCDVQIGRTLMTVCAGNTIELTPDNRCFEDPDFPNILGPCQPSGFDCYEYRVDGVSLGCFKANQRVFFVPPQVTTALNIDIIVYCLPSVTPGGTFIRAVGAGSFPVEVVGPADVKFSASSQDVCIGEEVCFSITGRDRFDYSNGRNDYIDFGDGSTFTCNIGTCPQQICHTYAEPGQYTVTLFIENECGINSHSEPPITVRDPVVDFTFTPVCAGSPVLFTDLTDCPGYVFQWDFGDGATSDLPNPTHVFPGSGSFQVTLLHIYAPNDAIRPVTKTVTFLTELPIVTGPGGTFCPGELPVTLTATPSGGTGPYTFIWSPAGSLNDPASPTPLASPSVTTTYGVTVTDANGCSGTATVTIGVGGPGDMIIGAPDVTVCPTSGPAQISLFTSGGTEPLTYAWSPAASLSDAGASDPLASPTTTTTYTVTVTDANGCTATAQVTVLFDPTCGNVCGSPATRFVPANASSLLLTDFVTDVVDLSGTVTIDNNFAIDNSNVRMAKGAAIVVNTGNTLTLRNTAHLYSCTELWNGITVMPGAKLVVEGRSGIEDAELAIDLKNGSLITDVSLAVLNGAILNKNYRHVVIRKFGFGHPFSTAGSDFTCKASNTSPGGTLKAPRSGERTLYDIEAENVRLVKVGDAAKAANLFQNAFVGIKATDTDLEVINNKFDRIIRLDFEAKFCPPQSFCPFPQEGVAVLAIDTDIPKVPPQVNIGPPPPPGANSIMVTRNEFTDCYRGIDVTNYFWNAISMNEFRNNPENFQGTPFLPIGDHGIFIKNILADDITVTGNRIFDFKTGLHVLRNYQSKGVHTVALDNNFIQSRMAHTGIFVEDINLTRQEYIDALNPAYSISRNEIYDAQTGIFIKYLSRRSGTFASAYGYDIDVVGNTITLIPAKPYSPRAGIRTAATSRISVRENIISGGTDIADPNAGRVKGIYMTLCPSSQVLCNEVTLVGQSMVFESLMLLTTVWNNKMTGALDGLVMLNDGQVGQQGAADKPSDNEWQGPFARSQANSISADGRLSPFFVRNITPQFKPLDNLNLPFNDPRQITFNNALGSSRTCPFTLPAVVSEDSAEALALLVSSREEDFKAFPEASRWLGRQFAFRLMTQKPDLMNGRPPLKAFYDSTTAACMGQLEEVDNLIAQGDLAAAQALNNRIKPTCLIEENAVTYNKINIRHLLNGRTALSSYEQAQLLDIARQCPLTGGEAVYKARTMVNLLVNGSVVFEDDCPVTAAAKTGNGGSPGISGDETTESVFLYTLFPNPNDGNMTLTYYITDGSTGSFDVFDLMGRKLVLYELAEGQGTLKIRQPLLERGTYVYRISVNGSTAAMGRLVVIR